MNASIEERVRESLKKVLSIESINYDDKISDYVKNSLDYIKIVVDIELSVEKELPIDFLTLDENITFKEFLECLERDEI